MEQVVEEIHRSARKKFPRRKTIIRHSNSNYKYMLFVIDTYSKFLWIQPLKNKTGKSVSEAFEKILVKSNRKPKILQTDDGTEFYNKLLERVIRTIKQKLFKKFSLNGSYKWINIIQDIVDQYNNTKHSTILMKPKQVTKKTKLHVFNELSKQFKKKKTKYKIDCYVRISKYRSIFDKGYHPNYSFEIFKIKKIQYINDMKELPIKGAFYEFELTGVKFPDIYLVEKVLRRKGNKLYVKFLGMPDKAWINKSDIFSKKALLKA